MKKVLVLVLICIVATTAGLAGSPEAKMAPFQQDIDARDMPLEEVLALLSAHSGTVVMAVPEVAGMKVNLRIVAGQSLEQVLTALSEGYQLTYRINDKNNTVIVFKDQGYSEARSMATYKSGVHSQKVYSAAPYYPGPGYPSRPMNTEEYNRIYDNNYQDALRSPLSTFSIDVDTASYSNVRRFINSGALPTTDAVRTEELINYFTYDYQQPTGEHPFSVTTEVAPCPWAPNHKLVMVGLQGKNIDASEIPSSNLVFLIDVSGSMNQPNKLPLLKSAFKLLVKQLRAQDRVSIVVYAGKAGVVLEPTSGSEKDKIISAIDGLEAGGSTAGGEGINLAYKVAKGNFITGGNNRVILATDGDFNVGVSSEGELTRLIEAHRAEGVFLSVLGFGMGNIKDNKMEALADKGNGNYAYIDNALEAKKVMVGQMAGTLYTIAKDVKLQVEFNPDKVKYYRLVGYENRVLADRDFNDDKKDAGDMGAGQSVTALYEIIPAGSAEAPGTIDPLIYQRPAVVPSNDLLKLKIRYKKPSEQTSVLFSKTVDDAEMSAAPSDNFRFAAAVSEYAMVLRKSEFKGQATYAHAIELAKSAKGQDEEGYRAEFIKLIEISRLLDDK